MMWREVRMSEERIEQDFDLRKQIRGIPRGMAPLVAEQSSRRGGRERSERWKGERGAFSLQEVDVGNRSVTSSHISRASSGESRDRTRLVTGKKILSI